MSSSARHFSLSAGGGSGSGSTPANAAGGENENNPQYQRRHASSIGQPSPGLRVPSNRKTIYDRHLNRSRNADLSRASFAYIFAEMVSYAQRKVTGIQDLEKR